MRLHSFHHVPYEGLDRIADWASARGHSVSVTRWDAGEKSVPVTDYDALVIMGGPQGVYEADRFSWIAEEQKAIRQAIDAGKKVLGICLGSQLIASVLGARVYPQPQKEIGWWPVTFDSTRTSDTSLAVFGPAAMMYHWHRDTFDLPVGTTLLASSVACTNQAFSAGRNVLALQFHPEISAGTINRWVAASTTVHHPKGFVMGVDDMNRQAALHLPVLEKTLPAFLEKFFYA